LFEHDSIVTLNVLDSHALELLKLISCILAFKLIT
jgi:hypothetical protein